MPENRYQKRFGSQPEAEVRQRVRQTNDVRRGYEDDMEREDYFGVPRSPSSARMPNTAPRGAQRSTTTQSYGTQPYRTQQPIRRTTASYDQPTVVSANQRLAGPVRETEKISTQQKQGKNNKKALNRRELVTFLGGVAAIVITGGIVNECYVQPAVRHWHEGDSLATVTNLGDKLVVGMVEEGNLIIVVMDSDGSNAQQFLQSGALYDKNPHEVGVTEQDVNHDGHLDIVITVDNLPGPVLYNTGSGYQWKDPTKK